MINDGEFVPGFPWVVPNGAGAADCERFAAWWIATKSPTLFTYKDSHVLFFSGGQGGRSSSIYEPWEALDNEFRSLTVEEAKRCSADRLRLEGAMDDTRRGNARAIAFYTAQPPDVVGYRVAADSDVESAGATTRGADVDTSDGEASSPSSSTQQRPVFRRNNLNDMCRTASDNSPASEDLPLLVPPKCVEPECSAAGTLTMVTCKLCDGDLHRACGDLIDPDDPESTERVCSRCAASGKGKGRSVA